MKLTENQEMYLNLFNEFVQQEVAPRIKELDEVDEYPIWMRDRMAELGFTRLVAPEEYGGFGESMTTLLMLIIEASKYNNNLASILNCSNNANKLLSFANQEQIDRFLPMIVDEGKFMGMAYTEPSGGSDSRATAAPSAAGRSAPRPLTPRPARRASASSSSRPTRPASPTERTTRSSAGAARTPATSTSRTAASPSGASAASSTRVCASPSARWTARASSSPPGPSATPRAPTRRPSTTPRSASPSASP